MDNVEDDIIEIINRYPDPDGYTIKDSRVIDLVAEIHGLRERVKELELDLDSMSQNVEEI